MKKILIAAFLIAAFVSCNNDDKGSSGVELPLNVDFTRIRVNTAEQLTDVHFLDKDNGVICGANASFMRTADGGVSWTYPTVPTDHSLMSVFMLDHEHVFTARKGLYATNAQGQFESRGGMENMLGNIFGLYFETPQKGFLLKQSNIMETTDGGNTWSVLFDGSPYLKEMVFVNSKVAFAYGGITQDGISGAVLFKTTDGGVTWTDLHREGAEILKSHFIDEHTGFIADYENKISKTTDGGVTWTEIGEVPNPRNGSAVSCLLYITDGQMLLSNYDGELFSSADTGKTWEKIYEHPKGLAISKIHRVDKTLYVIGDDGLVLKNN